MYKHDWIAECDTAAAPRGNVGEIGREMSDRESRKGDRNRRNRRKGSPGGIYLAYPLEFTRTLVLKVESKSSSALRKDRGGSDTTC